MTINGAKAPICKLHLVAISLIFIGVLNGVQGQAAENTYNISSTISHNSITCGYSHCCGIKSDGSAWCWGEYANLGQLGNNAVEGSLIPVLVSGGGTWATLSAGNATTCGLRDDLSLWCWGLNLDGEAGVSSSLSKELILAPTPIDMPETNSGSPTTWIDLSVGGVHACAIRSDYTLWCWGKTNVGALGNNQLSSVQMVPKQVYGGGAWSRVACGADFTCAISARNGTMFCFGSEQYGQCANAGAVSEVDPTLTPQRTISLGTDIWTDVYTGCLSSFAFAKQSDGSIWAWGDGRSGNLAAKEPGIVHIPQEVLNGSSWALFATGQSYTLGNVVDNGALAWGVGYAGQLGAGVGDNATFAVKPIDVKAPNGTQGGSWSDLAASRFQSCGIFSSKMYCWGSEQGGALGSVGDTVFTPREVEGNSTWGVAAKVVTLGPVPPPSSFPPPPDSSEDQGSNTGAIIGAALGGVLGVFIIAVIGIIFWRRKPQQLEGTAERQSSMPYSRTEALLMWAGRHRKSNSKTGSGRSASSASLSGTSSDMPQHIAPLEFTWGDVNVIKTLGTGSFGQVFLANINHAKMAVKVLVDAEAVLQNETTSRITGSSNSNASIPKAPTNKLIQEASIMASLQHPNVVHLLGFCTNPPCLAIEYCPRGSLYDVLNKAKENPEAFRPKLTWRRRLAMAREAAAGILHLHSRSPPIIHRDIKSPNLLVTGELSVKVCDMGLSKLDPRFSEDGVPSEVSYKASTAGGGGNPRWLAPEVLNGGKATLESDVFSFGIVLWELLVWAQPWWDANTWAVSSAVVRGERPAFLPYDQLPGFDGPLTPAVVDSLDKYVDLIKRCWKQDPVERPTMSVVAIELEQLIAALASSGVKSE